MIDCWTCTEQYFSLYIQVEKMTSNKTLAIEGFFLPHMKLGPISISQDSLRWSTWCHQKLTIYCKYVSMFLISWDLHILDFDLMYKFIYYITLYIFSRRVASGWKSTWSVCKLLYIKVKVKVLSIIEESSVLTFKQNVPVAMENVFYEISNVDTFIRKIRNRVKLAIKRQDNNLLMEDVFTNVPNAGNQLMALGITEEWLENPVPIEIPSIFSKEAVLELNFYKKKKNAHMNS